MKPLAPDSSITLMIVDTARLLRKRFEIALSHVETGLTVSEARALAIIWRNPGLRQTALADRMNVEPMTLVGYLDALEKAGLIARQADPSDRRAKLVVLTEEADPVLDKIGMAMTELRAEVLAGVSQEEQKLLEGLLGTLKGNLLSGEAGNCNR
ncbi:MarR family winged helix-turn-helix transcriptional regulator [Roseibium litorale]|uniref:MarR family transcriptional regulator n=1 Tax=Roseibium litorale TaxID=2803841 RepID=A0ABR9CMQ2_9HYPH|nr:MarR family transcriptional regulator [Roseibium litorale]MBD8891581.1 MarR family transcriptional regulator [Roseibium litorale]